MAGRSQAVHEPPTPRQGRPARSGAPAPSAVSGSNCWNSRHFFAKTARSRTVPRNLVTMNYFPFVGHASCTINRGTWPVNFTLSGLTSNACRDIPCVFLQVTPSAATSSTAQSWRLRDPNPARRRALRVPDVSSSASRWSTREESRRYRAARPLRPTTGVGDRAFARGPARGPSGWPRRAHGLSGATRRRARVSPGHRRATPTSGPLPFALDALRLPVDAVPRPKLTGPHWSAAVIIEPVPSLSPSRVVKPGLLLSPPSVNLLIGGGVPRLEFGFRGRVRDPRSLREPTTTTLSCSALGPRRNKPFRPS